ncbi:MAG: hypothetical protein BJ554DRAFT_3584 [Olpidium bornovanus]|uniref:Integrase catalytic domain-containing protein n=1 Tax=Olpidium bornovanus TaxID=278681 RepID=A0A8H8DFQ2_9FUNG|nr:MAG: hypothetical protein BJ554DRAFT_3584 [Olpidium bornovanus]
MTRAPQPRGGSEKETSDTRGLPVRIVADCGRAWTSNFWTAFCKTLASSYSLPQPATNRTEGQAGRAIGVVKTMVATYYRLQEAPTGWLRRQYSRFLHNSRRPARSRVSQPHMLQIPGGSVGGSAHLLQRFPAFCPSNRSSRARVPEYRRRRTSPPQICRHCNALVRIQSRYGSSLFAQSKALAEQILQRLAVSRRKSGRRWSSFSTVTAARYCRSREIVRRA